MEVPEGYILIKKTEYENLLRHITELMLRCEALEAQNQQLIKRIEELEAKQKMLEQQVLSQQKQFQQLVDFIKKKFK